MSRKYSPHSKTADILRAFAKTAKTLSGFARGLHI